MATEAAAEAEATVADLWGREEGGKGGGEGKSIRPCERDIGESVVCSMYSTCAWNMRLIVRAERSVYMLIVLVLLSSFGPCTIKEGAQLL